MFSTNADAYKNAAEHILEEEFYIREWRRDGPLGVFFDDGNYINTPKQWSIFADCQATVGEELPQHQGSHRAPVKPVITRWNSYYDSFVRGVELCRSFHILSGALNVRFRQTRL